MPESGSNPLVKFVNDKYNAGDISKLDSTKELLYSDPKEFDNSLQEGYNHLKSTGKTSAATYGEFRDTFIKQYGGPAVVKKKDETQSQAPNPNQEANTALFDSAKQLFKPSDQQNKPVEDAFQDYKANTLSSAYAPNLKQEPENIDLNANLSPSEFPTENQKEQSPDQFKPDFATENTQTPLNQAVKASEQNGGTLPLNSMTIGDVEVKKQADTDAIIKNKTDQMNGYDNTMYYLNDFGGRVNKRLLETPASLLDFVARSAYNLDRLSGTNPDKPYEDYVSGQWADQYRETLDKYLGEGIAFESTDTGGKKELDDHIQSQIAPAVADLLTVLAGGGAGSAGTKMLTQSALRNPNVTIGALKELGTYVATPGAFVSGAQVFNSEYEQAYNTLRQNGADEETARNEAWNSGMRNAIISAPLEALPAGKFFDRLDQLSGGGFKTRMTSMMVNGVKGFSEEAATEVAQQFFSNVDASLAYDETRQWTDGLIEAGVIGGLLGGTLNGITSGLTYRRDNAKTPEERKQYQKAIDHVVEKSQEIETVKSENESLKNAGQIQNIDNGITEILDKKDNISNDEIQQIEMLELQKQDINKPMMDDLSRKTSGIDARIKDLILQRDLIYSSAMTGAQIQQASVKEKEIGQELINLYKEKYNVRKKILAKQYIQKAQDSIANLNLPEETKLLNTQENATTGGEQTSSNTREHIGVNPQLQEEGSNREEPPKIEGSSNKASSSNSIQQGEGRQEKIVEPSSPIEKLETVMPEIKPNENIRKTAITISGRQDIPKEVKEKTLSNAIYPVKSLDVTSKEADDLLKEHIDKGDDSVLSYVNNIPNDIKQDVKIGIRAAGLRYFAKKYSEANKAGNEELATRYAEAQADIIDRSILEQGTELGRAVNAHKLLKYSSPEVQVISTRNAIEKVRNEYKEKNKDRFKATVSELNESNKDIAKATRKDKRIQEKLNKIKEANTYNVKAKKYNVKKEKIAQAKTEAKQQLDKLFKELGNRASSGVDPQLVAKIVAQGAKYGYYLAIEGYYDFKEWSIKMKADLGDDSEQYLDDIWKAQHEGEKISAVANQVKQHEVANNTEKVIKENIDEKFDKIVEKHYSEVEKTKSDLVKKLTDDLDVPENDANELAKLVEETFDKLATEKKLAILRSKTKFGDKVYPKKMKQTYEKVIQLSNVGSIDENQLADIYADEFSSKELTPDQIKQLRKLADKVQAAPEGFQKQNAIQDLYKYQDTIKGINWADVATSWWYASILSGYKTHIVNTVANIFKIGSEGFISAARDPRNIPFITTGLVKGLIKGITEAKITMATGYSPVKSSKVDTLNALENNLKIKVPFTDVKITNPLVIGKYIGRAMAAADALAYSGAKEMRAYEMAANEARTQKKSKPDARIWEQVSEILNNTKDKEKAAELQATEEGLKGTDFKRRVNEILEQNRNSDIKEDSSLFGLRSTFNQEPEGVLGVITNWIGNWIEKADLKNAHPLLSGVKPLKLIIPFTRIISNVANSTLDWTPWGGKRAIFGTLNRNLNTEDRIRLAMKAVTGIIAMISTMALSDPEDGVFEITADGTGDVQKNYELAKDTGWQKYSIKIKGTNKWVSYKETQLMSSLAMIGNIRDGVKYKSETLDDKNIAEKVGLAYLYNLRVITDMTVLKSFGEFLGIFGTNTPTQSLKYLEKMMASSAKAVIVPNLYSQAAKDVMRINDMPMKQVNHAWENIYKDIPIANENMYPMINSLGDEIKPDTDKFLSEREPLDPKTAAVEDLIAKNNAWVGSINIHQLQSSLDDINAKKRSELKNWDGLVTDRQFYEYSKKRGELIKNKIMANLDVLNKMKPEDVRDAIDKYKRQSTKNAKYQIFKLY